MEILEMIIMPIVSLLILFVLTKLMGYRQVAQLNMYDYIIGITLGNIAGSFIMDGINGYLKPLIALLVYAGFTIFLSWITAKNSKVRRFVEGKAVIVYQNDEIHNKQLHKAKMDIDEFLMACRSQGYFNLHELDTVVLETHGSFSFFPKEKYRPTQLNDLNVTIQNIGAPTLLIKEGIIQEETLHKINKDSSWLEKTLSNMNVEKEDVILMYQEDNSNIQVYTVNNKRQDFK